MPTGESAAIHVDVWCADLDAHAPHVEAYRALLDAAERERAHALGSERRRREFVVTRALLRTRLATRLGCAPHEVPVRIGDNGRPELAGGDATGQSTFSLAHSRDRALVAMAARGAVGVDLECPNRETAWERLAERFFSESEWLALARLEPDAGRSAFFRCWTRKEAVLKATGDGVAGHLKAFDVSVDAELARVLATRWEAPAVADVALSDLDVAGYAAALAVVAPAAALGGRPAVRDVPAPLAPTG